MQVLLVFPLTQLKEVRKYLYKILFHLLGILALYVSQKYANGQPIDKVQTRQEQEKYAQLEQIQQRFLRTDIHTMDPTKIISSIKTLFE